MFCVQGCVVDPRWTILSSSTMVCVQSSKSVASGCAWEGAGQGMWRDGSPGEASMLWSLLVASGARSACCDVGGDSESQDFPVSNQAHPLLLAYRVCTMNSGGVAS